MPLAAGDKLGPYDILAPIGAGGMGEVWKARDTRLNRIVAIKRLTGQHTGRFEQEARAIAALNHPHICQIYDVGPDYIVMEYVEGAPLKGPLAVEDAIRLAIQIASALEEAHDKRILHRDLKPANILVTAKGGSTKGNDKGNAKLLDFGLAKLIADGDATQTLAVMGTPAYMSPEQAEGKGLDERSDIFSFGVVLYEMLSGRRPFESLGAVLRDRPAPLESPAAEIAMRCLAKAPRDRFQSMAEVKAALERAPTAPASQQPSIAVLPFANMSADKEQEYFSDGLAEEIINALVKVPGLKVIARTSAFAFKGQNTDIRKIAEVLGVTNVLEGSVRRAGNRIRVTAQLIEASNGTHLWSERYDRQMEDIFEMQDEIAAAIATQLKLKFAPDPDARPRRQPNLQAYEAYLRHLKHYWGITPESDRRSRECVEQAVALDPEFALPYIGLANCHFSSFIHGGRIDDTVFRVREAVQRALQLDPDLPEAHAMLGILAGNYDLDWKEAERLFNLAMAREPVSWLVRAWYSTWYLCPVGRAKEARREAERALVDDPLSQILHWGLGMVLEGLGLEEEALSALQKSVELDPQFWVGWHYLGLHHAVRARYADARQCAEKAFALYPSSWTIGSLAGVLRSLGETARAEALLADVGSEVAPIALTYFHLVCCESDAAVEWAGKLVAQRNPLFLFDFARPYEKHFRQAPGWQALLRKLKVPEVSS